MGACSAGSSVSSSSDEGSGSDVDHGDGDGLSAEFTGEFQFKFCTRESMAVSVMRFTQD